MRYELNIHQRELRNINFFENTNRQTLEMSIERKGTKNY